MKEKTIHPGEGENLRATQMPIVFLTSNFKLISPEHAFLHLRTLSQFDDMLPYLPTVIQQYAGFDGEGAPPSRDVSTIDIEKFVWQMHMLGENFIYPTLPKYFGTNTRLCMDLTSLMTTYLSRIYGLPVVGRYSLKDEKLPAYIRPITTIFDRKSQYPEYISESGRFSLEDALEVKIGDTRIITDFNFWYKHREGSRVLIHDVSHREGRKQLGLEYGLWTTAFKGFKLKNLPPEAANYYTNRRMPMQFLFTIGNIPLIEAYNREGFPDIIDDNERRVRWPDFMERFMHESITTQEYMDTGSTGALVSAGYETCDLSGRGKAFLVPENFHWKKILLELPQISEEIK